MDFNFAILLDTIVVVILIYFVVNSARRGFVANVINLLRYATSYFLAAALSNHLTKYIYDAFIKHNLDGFFSEKIKMLYGLDPNIAAIGENLEILETIKQRLPFLNLDGLGSSLKKFVPGSSSQTLTDIIIYPVIRCIVGTLLFFVIMRVCKIVARQLMHVAMKINRIPLLGGFNGLLGGVFGLVEALIVIVILAEMTNAIIMVSGNSLPYLNFDVVNKSHLAKHFFEIHKYL
ncbi:hypothetical protein FACS189481_2970 [Clostridia bacterium]|nr:hypothetical protein FACS189481_2970 [Clostridia bacterium]